MKRLAIILSVAAIIMVMAGCNAGSNELKQKAEMEQQNMETIQQMWEDWNNRNYDQMATNFADAFMYYTPYGNPQGMTKDETKYAVEQLWTGNPDMKATIVKLMADGNTVTQLLMMSGTNTGEFMGMPATNKEFTFGVISVFMFEDGKVKVINEAADQFGWMKQLGVF